MHGPMIFLFPLVVIVVVFTFTAVIHWVDSSRKEREAFYRAETLKRIGEAPGDGAKATIELLREQDRLRRIKAREGLKIGGMINVGVGIGLLIFLRSLVGWEIGMCGLIPGFIGLAMLVYVYFLADPII